MFKKPGWVTRDIDELAAVFYNADSIEEIRLFLRDLLTDKELLEISNRWKIARMLKIKMSWSKISRLTGASTATISNINKKLKNENGGYNIFLNKLLK